MSVLADAVGAPSGVRPDIREHERNHPRTSREPRRPVTSARPAPSCCRWRLPDADAIVRQSAAARGEKSKVDVLLVNPPSPDGGIWIRTQHRVGRRSRENMIWPQVLLAQMAALLQPTYTVEIVDAIAERMGWPEFEAAAARVAAALLPDPGHRADADQRHVRRLPGASLAAPDDGLRHARHADGARDAARRIRRSTSSCAASRS